MAQSVLITPVDGPLGSELTTRCLKLGYSIVAAHIAEAPPADFQIKHERLHTVRWDPHSFISARNLVLTGINAFGTLDATFLVVEEERTGDAFHRSSPVAIETCIDTEVKGVALVARESLAAFVRAGSGRLSTVLYAPGERTNSILGNVAVASVAALAEGLMQSYQYEPVTIDSFITRKPDIEAYVSYILETGRNDRTGGVHRFGAHLLHKLSPRTR